MKKLLSDVLSRIEPSELEVAAVKKRINSVLTTLNSRLKDAKAVLGGSGIKDTWLKESYDADIFVKFNYKKFKDKEDQLSDILEKSLKGMGVKRVHGSRDYFQIPDNSFNLEIIPILDIKNSADALNITDVSPLHSGWVNKKGKGLKGEIRLLKQFCKANRVYGAESHINGFSGYVCEVLTIHYGGFEKVLRAAAKWKEGEVIDPENYWKNQDVSLELNKSKTISPIIIIDPVQKDRNAAAALSDEKLTAFQDKCKGFLKKPSAKFFEKVIVDDKYLKKITGKNQLITIRALATTGKEDVVGCKLVKVMEFFIRGLEREEFTILKKGWEWEKDVLFYFVIKKEKRSKTHEVMGPPVEIEKHAKVFKKKYPKSKVKDGKLIALAKRNYMDAQKLVNDLSKDTYTKGKVKKFK